MNLAGLLSGLGISGSLLGILIGAAMLVWAMASRDKTGLRPVLALLGSSSVVLGVGASFLDDTMMWGWTMAMLPSALVAHHAIYLVWIKPRFLPDDFAKPEENAKPEEKLKHLRGGRVLAEAVRASNKYFAPSNIVLRLGMPALILLITGLTLVFVLHPASPLRTKVQESVSAKPGVLEAARFGAAGAFIYVLTYLGQRGFRHDISSGAALWCAVTLLIGPILAVVVALVWVPSQGASNWAQQLVYFFAGASPRTMTHVLKEAAQRLLAGKDSVVQQPSRSIPLGYIGGITPEIAERLLEEGIQDVYALSMADPHRLLRNTPFGRKEILDWIDQAMLIRSLPAHWEKLVQAGVGGAIDLAWYVEKEGNGNGTNQ